MRDLASISAVRTWRLLATAVVLVMGVAGDARAQVSAEFCGPLYVPPASPPWDFRTDKYFLPIVENAHFTPLVELLVRGRTTGKVGPDLDYTLGRFPNHPRALVAVTNLHRRDPNTQKELLPRPVECYFERAIRFAADDPVVRMLFADFLIGEKRTREAEFQLKYTLTLAGDSAITHRNIGLLYLQLRDYDRVLEQAHRVEALKNEQPLPDGNMLKDELERLGLWREPAEPAASTASMPTSAAPAYGQGSDR